mgnify:CR=1 FL=1
MIQDVYIIGATGKVGRELVKQIFEKGDTDPARHLNPTRVVGLASSTHTLYLPQGISQEQASAFAKKDYAGTQKYGRLEELLERARYGLRGEESTLVFVDATALNEPMTQFHLKVIEQTPYGIVTANKNPIALSDYKTFLILTSDVRRYGYRCSVMAGADAVPFVRDAKDLDDKIYSIEGCLSGTNTFILSELEKFEEDGVTLRALSDTVRKAWKEGYTEPHPRDDLNGLDVTRKLIVIARSAGLPIGIDDISRKALIPEEYLHEDNVDKFLSRLTQLDGTYRQKMADAMAYGNTLRYVARIDMHGESPIIKVSLQEIPKNSSLGSLEGTLNAIVIITESYPKGYPIGPAPGAGLQVTARNIRRDMLDLLPQRRNGV